MRGGVVVIADDFTAEELSPTNDIQISQGGFKQHNVKKTSPCIIRIAISNVPGKKEESLLNSI
jgi:hypothetical protein